MAGGDDIRVVGAEQLERLSHRLKAAGDGGLRKELLSRIRASAKPLVSDVRESARQELPSRGGLADLIASSKIGIRTKLSGTISVRLTASSPHDLVSLNAGKLRHPVFSTGTWAQQSVPEGWFDKPPERRAPQIRRDLVDLMGDVARKITRGP